MSELIPPNWKTVRLGQIASIISGGTPDREKKKLWGSDIPWVTPTDITNTSGRYLFDTKEGLSSLGLKSCSANVLPTGTILLTSRATVGDSRIALRAVCTNQGFKSIIPDKGVDYLFLFYQIQRCREKYKAFGIGSTFLEVSKKDTEQFELLLPENLTEQKRISRIIDSIDQTIEKTEALIHKYHQIKTGLMHDLFTRGVTADGKVRPSREEAPELYRETLIGWVPKEWRTEPLKKLTLKIVDGIHHTPHYVDYGIPFVTVKNLTASSDIDFNDLNFITEQDHHFCCKRADPKEGDVLVTKDGTLGVCRIVKKGMPEFSIFVSVAMLRVTEELTADWLHMFFESGNYLRQLSYLSAGTGLKHIHLQHFKKFEIPLPDINEQILIKAKLEFVTHKIQIEEKLLLKLQKQKSGLMQDLLTGRVRVKVDQEEPAHV